MYGCPERGRLQRGMPHKHTHTHTHMLAFKCTPLH